MKAFYSKHGFTVFADSKYTASTDYLLPGDIHVKAGTHTVMVCGTGSKVGTIKSNTSTGGFDMSTLSNIKSGSTGAQVKSLQILLNGKNSAGLTVDGQAGTKTVAAIKSYQSKNGLTADGECGPKTWAKILGA
jgi:peptidoglycan hydrolase-like protein with peptidoglycan-binding domain